MPCVLCLPVTWDRSSFLLVFLGGNRLPISLSLLKTIGSCTVHIDRLAEGEKTSFHSISSHSIHVPLYYHFATMRALVHARFAPRDRIRRAGARHLCSVFQPQRRWRNAYADLESASLIQPGHVDAARHQGQRNGLKIPAFASGSEWKWCIPGHCSSSDERGEEILSRLTAIVPEMRISFVMAPRRKSFFLSLQKLQCKDLVNAVLRREGADVLNLGPSAAIRR